MKLDAQMNNLHISSIEIIPSKMEYEKGNLYIVAKQQLPKIKGYGEESQVIHRFLANTLDEGITIALARAEDFWAIRKLCPDYITPNMGV